MLECFCKKYSANKKKKRVCYKKKMESITTNQTNKEIEEFIEGDYISIKEGESRVLEFGINKMKLVDKTDFNGNPVRKVQFLVIDPQDPERREKKFELSKKHVPKIYGELKKGKTVLEIFRIGQGKQTEYHVKAIR
jgi:hypothetical protein